AWKRTFQPDAISELAFKADPKFAQYAASKSGEHDRIIREGLKHERFWEKVPEEKQLKFLSDVESRRPVDPEFKPYEDRFRKMMNDAYTEEKKWGSKAAYIEDYVSHEWQRPTGNKIPISKFFENLGPTWFQKARHFEFIEEGLKA